MIRHFYVSPTQHIIQKVEGTHQARAPNPAKHLFVDCAHKHGEVHEAVRVSSFSEKK
jgi:hypothetical protein